MPNLTYWLVGMPNVGKSSLFQKITGANVKIANWEGVTIRCRASSFDHGRLVDTPGRRHVYMNEPCWTMSPKEWVGVEHYRIIHVVDAAYLERDLMLTAQWLTLGLPMGIVIHRSDLNEHLDLLSIEKWSKQHNVPVICTHLADSKLCDNFYGLVRQLQAISPRKPTVDTIAKSFDTNDSINVMADWFGQAATWAAEMLKSQDKINLHRRTDWMDGWFLKSRFAPLIGWVFLCLSLLIILWLGQVTQLLGQFLWFQLISVVLPASLQDYWLVRSAVDSFDVVVGLLPLIFFVYVWLSAIEHSGYGIRLGVLLTPILKWAGLPGGVWISMMLGFGCNVPAIQALKTIPYPKHRLIAATMLPMIPCSARLMVFVVIAGMMCPMHATWVVLSLYMLSMLVALSIARLLSGIMNTNHTVFQSQSLVPYQKPIWRLVFTSAGIQAWAMVYRVMVFVLPLNVFIAWLDQTTLASDVSLLVYLGQKLTVLFYPIGLSISDWPFVMGLFTGLIAKEAMLATLGSLGMIGQIMPQPETWTELWHQIRYVSAYLFMMPATHPFVGGWSLATTMAYLIFVSLYMPCISTYAMLRKVIGWRANVVTVASIILAYMLSVVVYVGMHISLSWYLVGLAVMLFYTKMKSYMQTAHERF